jgi:cysteinyl-tRNA synthetase
MTVRFFMLQAQYRGTLDFSNEALQSAQKGYKRLMNGLRILKHLEYQADESVTVDEKNRQEVNDFCAACVQAIEDDLNTAVVIANLFNLLRKVNSIHTGQLKTAALGEETFNRMKTIFISFIEEILGLLEEKASDTSGLIASMLDLYRDAKTAREYDKVDRIRSFFKSQGLVIKDMKTGIDWAYEE